MSWSDVQAGDWVRVSQNITDTEISGTIIYIGVGGAEIGGVILLPALWDVQEVRKTYKVGDIGFLKNRNNHYIGVYAADGSFYMHGTKMFRNTETGIKILGNVNDL